LILKHNPQVNTSLFLSFFGSIANNPQYFIRRLIQDGVPSLDYVPIEGQVENIFTKPLESPSFI